MATSNFKLRGISPEVMSMLKQTAKEQRISINLLIISFIEQGIGFSHKVKRRMYTQVNSKIGISGAPKPRG